MEKIACALFVFDRPDYLAQVLQSLERQTYDNVSWYAFVDGCALGSTFVGDPKGREKSVNLLIDSKIKFKYIATHTENHGMGRQKLASHALYDMYDTVLFFEDDLILSKHYIEVLLKLKDMHPDYEFLTACDRPRVDQPHFDKMPLTKLIGGGTDNITHYWGYYLSKRVVQLLDSPLREYCSMYGDDYRGRPHEAIRKRFEITTTSHDGVLDREMKRAGVIRAGTDVPRARYIGKKGLHCTPKIFSEFHEKKYEFEEEPFRL